MSPAESPWLLVAVGAAVIVVALVRVLPQKRLAGLAVALLGVLMVIGGFVVDAFVVTTAERLEQELLRTVELFRANDTEAVVEQIAADRPALRLQAAAGVAFVDVAEDYRLTDLSVRERDDVATQHFRLNGEFLVGVAGSVGRRPTRWELDWKETGDGRWQIDAVRRLDPLSGETLGLLDAR